jgi:hypothetical protein
MRSVGLPNTEKLLHCRAACHSAHALVRRPASLCVIAQSHDADAVMREVDVRDRRAVGQRSIEYDRQSPGAHLRGPATEGPGDSGSRFAHDCNIRESGSSNTVVGAVRSCTPGLRARDAAAAQTLEVGRERGCEPVRHPERRPAIRLTGSMVRIARARVRAGSGGLPAGHRATHDRPAIASGKPARSGVTAPSRERRAPGGDLGAAIAIARPFATFTTVHDPGQHPEHGGRRPAIHRPGRSCRRELRSPACARRRASDEVARGAGRARTAVPRCWSRGAGLWYAWGA